MMTLWFQNHIVVLIDAFQMNHEKKHSIQHRNIIIYKMEVFKLVKNNNQIQWKQINPTQIGHQCIYIDQE